MPKKESLSTKKLFRSETNRVIAGVAGGLGEYFEIDPTLIRIVFVLITVFGGSGILIYIILWILIPNETDKEALSEETIMRNAKEIGEKAKNFTQNMKHSSDKHSSRNFVGLFIILLGLLFLFDNLGFLRFNLFWPLILVAIGLLLLLK